MKKAFQQRRQASRDKLRNSAKKSTAAASSRLKEGTEINQNSDIYIRDLPSPQDNGPSA